MSTQILTLSPSPHYQSDASVKKIMYGVVIALIPALVVSLVFFGLGAVKVTLTAIAACILFEYIIQKFLLKVPVTISDGSALVTGLLLAFNVPSNLPVWMIIVGSLVAIGMGKMSFGGLGNNPFNPALVGRVFLMISFPVHMTSWPKPLLLNSSMDGATGATALGVIKESLKQGESMSEILTKIPTYTELLLGQIGGSLGEVSALALILGGLYMIYKKIISWHIPVCFMGTVAFITGILWLLDGQHNANPIIHLLSGGLMLGSIFMATDMVTSPMSSKGMIIFGIGCGVLTVLIRNVGAYPEGVAFSILIMNAFVPIINIMLKPKPFGHGKA